MDMRGLNDDFSRFAVTAKRGIAYSICPLVGSVMVKGEGISNIVTPIEYNL
jgi:hypothetical protein